MHAEPAARNPCFKAGQLGSAECHPTRVAGVRRGRPLGWQSPSSPLPAAAPGPDLGKGKEALAASRRLGRHQSRRSQKLFALRNCAQLSAGSPGASRSPVLPSLQPGAAQGRQSRVERTESRRSPEPRRCATVGIKFAPGARRRLAAFPLPSGLLAFFPLVDSWALAATSTSTPAPPGGRQSCFSIHGRGGCVYSEVGVGEG